MQLIICWLRYGIISRYDPPLKNAKSSVMKPLAFFLAYSRLKNAVQRLQKLHPLLRLAAFDPSLFFQYHASSNPST